MESSQQCGESSIFCFGPPCKTIFHSSIYFKFLPSKISNDFFHLNLFKFLPLKIFNAFSSDTYPKFYLQQNEVLFNLASIQIFIFNNFKWFFAQNIFFNLASTQNFTLNHFKRFFAQRLFSCESFPFNLLQSILSKIPTITAFLFLPFMRIPSFISPKSRLTHKPWLRIFVSSICARFPRFATISFRFGVLFSLFDPNLFDDFRRSFLNTEQSLIPVFRFPLLLRIQSPNWLRECHGKVLWFFV
jgi:hypothetical protein